jgi:hypothetical protein
VTAVIEVVLMIAAAVGIASLLALAAILFRALLR